MNTDELRDELYAARDELTRLIADGAPTQPNADLPDAATFQDLVRARDELTYYIDRVVSANLTAATAGFDGACQKIVASTQALKGLATKSADIATAINVVGQIVGAATSLLTAVG